MENVLGRGQGPIADNGADTTAPAPVNGGLSCIDVPVLSGARVLLATGHTVMRKGFDGACLAGAGDVLV
jgi:hypothetical protein